MQTAPGTVAAGPGRRGDQRTVPDVLADRVSLLVLLGLGSFAIAVSFQHVMDFVREHGQHTTWVVVGTAVTVVALTLQAGLETYRDSRAGRGRGGPALLLGVAVVAELYANASTAPGGMLNRLVAAWPVLVAAAALALWTRRLQHAAEADERAGKTMTALLWDEVPAPVPPDDEELADTSTARERVLDILTRAARTGDEVPGPTELGRRASCSKQYASSVLSEWRSRPENQPGQTPLFAASAAA